MYVLAGCCTITIGLSTWELRADDNADLPEGSYEFRVPGAQPVELVWVWELPSAIWGDDEGI
jgi:hypothetical protein